MRFISDLTHVFLYKYNNVNIFIECMDISIFFGGDVDKVFDFVKHLKQNSVELC